MPYSQYRPDLMGSATLEPNGRLQAGSWQSFKLVYTCGRFGIDDTGSLKIGFRFATDFGPVQFDDPKAPGYTTVEASNGATLDTRWEFKRNIRPWSRSLYIGIGMHFLKPGDTVTIRFGDQRQGSPGVRLQTYCEGEFQFRIFPDAIATYDYVALPENPTINIVPGPPLNWHAIQPSLVAAGTPFRLSIKATDEWGNPSDQCSGVLHLKSDGPIAGLPDTLTLEPGAFAAIAEGLSVSEPGTRRITICDEAGDELCRSNPLRIQSAPERVHFWGDIHGQSNETLGTNTARDYFLFGRDRAFLDVMSHQGNDFQITGKFWRELNELMAELDEPGRFCCFPGYEWSANTAVGGDRNVYFRHEGETMHRSSHAQIADATDIGDEPSDAHDAHDLFERLQGKDCVMMAHVGGRYADITFAHDGRLETAVEVHSSWGTFEWIVEDAFKKGFRIGIVGNSDGHKGRPGACYPGASFFGSMGGLTCYLAPKLDRDAIFEAMRRRHHYATTGARIYLDVRAELPSAGEVFARDPSLGETTSEPTSQLIMGDIARVNDDEVVLAIDIEPSAAIERVDIFDGLDLIETIRPYEEADLGARIRLTYEGAEYRGRSRTTVWDGSLTLSGNEIVRAEMFNNWNVDRGIRSQDANALTWKAVTTGNYGGIDLWLSDATAGRLSVTTEHGELALDVSEIGRQDHVVEAGGLERRLRLKRLPESMQPERLTLRRSLKVRADDDTRLFVRVQQIDGHRAWSSPIYLFKG